MHDYCTVITVHSCMNMPSTPATMVVEIVTKKIPRWLKRTASVSHRDSTLGRRPTWVVLYSVVGFLHDGKQ
jgi:hypothetical protein